MNEPHQVKYKDETIEVWQGSDGRWLCCIVARGLGGIGPDEDFDSPEAAVDVAMAMIDECIETEPDWEDE